jgi:hypothetical protein
VIPAADARTIVAVLGAVVTILQNVFPSAHWAASVSAVATAVLVAVLRSTSPTSPAPTSPATSSSSATSSPAP